ncbi:hypothetical protein SDC9_197214 [bioreactor metagenome]|uniref:Uncharacterized protein n=1 Tax=bioreactor metagenome TaxID=1076179 RepID=A0A645IFI2_9ZZZZ
MGPGIGPDFLRMDKSGKTKSVFGFRIFYSVTANDDGSCFCQFSFSTFKDSCQYFGAQLANREGDNIKGGYGLSAHGINIADTVGSCNLTKSIGIIHHRAKKVNRLHQRCRLIQFVYAGIIRCADSN